MYYNNSCCKLRLQLCQFDVQNFIRTAIIVFEQHKIFFYKAFFFKKKQNVTNNDEWKLVLLKKKISMKRINKRKAKTNISKM